MTVNQRVIYSGKILPVHLGHEAALWDSQSDVTLDGPQKIHLPKTKANNNNNKKNKQTNKKQTDDGMTLSFIGL